MAYENYTFVSWTDGTPLTSERLAQMSMNVEQVRDANDNKPNGLLQFIEASSGTLLSNVVALNQSIIALTNPPGGTDRRVNADASRYIRIVCVFPGFNVRAQGAEDSVLSLKFYQQVQGASYYENTSPLTSFDFAIPPYSFYNVSSFYSNKTFSLIFPTAATTVQYDITLPDGFYTVIDITNGRGRICRPERAVTIGPFFCAGRAACTY